MPKRPNTSSRLLTKPHPAALLIAVGLCALSSTAVAGSVGSYSGCKSLRGERSACEACVGGGNFYQPGQGCGMVAGMHKSKEARRTIPPKPPSAMPKTAADYVTIKPGTFDIGARDIDEDKRDDESFDAAVTLTRPFMMKTTEVTHGEWLFIMRAGTPSWDEKCGYDCPVTYVGWRQALEYLNALSKREKLEPCYEITKTHARWPKGLDCTGYRLPTEAEWEFAARGGLEESRYGEVDTIAWYQENSGGAAHPVGKKQKNAYGLHDMLGNAAEWVWDKFEFKSYPQDVTDPIVGGLEVELEEGFQRSRRGSHFKDHRIDTRATYREHSANDGTDFLGFRPVRSLPVAK